MERRLPIYLMLDVSGSMSGEPIKAVREGVKLVYENLIASPVAMDVAYVSVITFGTKAEEAVPLTGVFEFRVPEIKAEGFTAMGAALSLLADSIERDIKHKKDANERGDYRPIVFLLTDGAPTDDQVNKEGINPFEEGVRRIHEITFANFIACGAGEKADMGKLEYITSGLRKNGFAVPMRDFNGETINKFFQLVSDSIVSFAETPSDSGFDAGIENDFVNLLK